MEEVRGLLTQAFRCCNPYCSLTIHIKLHFASCVSRKLKYVCVVNYITSAIYFHILEPYGLFISKKLIHVLFTEQIDFCSPSSNADRARVPMSTCLPFRDRRRRRPQG